jgi:hypothetical protein
VQPYTGPNRAIMCVLSMEKNNKVSELVATKATIVKSKMRCKILTPMYISATRGNFAVFTNQSTYIDIYIYLAINS